MRITHNTAKETETEEVLCKINPLIITAVIALKLYSLQISYMHLIHSYFTKDYKPPNYEYTPNKQLRVLNFIQKCLKLNKK